MISLLCLSGALLNMVTAARAWTPRCVKNTRLLGALFFFGLEGAFLAGSAICGCSRPPRLTFGLPNSLRFVFYLASSFRLGPINPCQDVWIFCLVPVWPVRPSRIGCRLLSNVILSALMWVTLEVLCLNTRLMASEQGRRSLQWWDCDKTRVFVRCDRKDDLTPRL